MCESIFTGLLLLYKEKSWQYICRSIIWYIQNAEKWSYHQRRLVVQPRFILFKLPSFRAIRFVRMILVLQNRYHICLKISFWKHFFI